MFTLFHAGLFSLMFNSLYAGLIASCFFVEKIFLQFLESFCFLLCFLDSKLHNMLNEVLSLWL